MKKILILTILIIFLTSCDVNYSILIDKDFIDENLTVEEKSIDNWYTSCSDYYNISCIEYFKEQATMKINSDINKLDSVDEYSNEKGLYKIEYTENQKMIGFSYNYKFNIDDYSKSSILNRCIENIDIINEKNIIKVHASGSFTCKYKNIDNIKVSIKSNYYTIKNSNANSKLFGTHAWKLDVDGENDVYFELYDEPQKEKLLKIVIAMFIVAAIATPIIILFMIARRKKNNEI